MKLLNTVSWLVILVVLAPFIAFAAGNYLPQFDGFAVTGGSMEPEIKTGALLFTQNVPADQIQVGDTITFSDGDHYTTHEVIGVESSNGETLFRTQGTANNSPDPGTVTEDELQGKKLFSIPFLGYFIVWAGTLQGLLILVVLPGLLLIASEATSLFRELKES